MRGESLFDDTSSFQAILAERGTRAVGGLLRIIIVRCQRQLILMREFPSRIELTSVCSPTYARSLISAKFCKALIKRNGYTPVAL